MLLVLDASILRKRSFMVECIQVVDALLVCVVCQELEAVMVTTHSTRSSAAVLFDNDKLT